MSEYITRVNELNSMLEHNVISLTAYGIMRDAIEKMYEDLF
jgi:hypothetical protein